MKRGTLIAAIAGGVVVILLWYFLLFAPTSKDLDDTKDDVASAESQKQELENTVRRLKELSRNAPQQEATLRTLRAAIPANPDLGEFILQANDIASAAGIDWLSISPSPPAAGGGSGPNSTIGLSIQVDGGFFQVLDYLNRLEDLDRLIIVDSLNLSAAAADESAGDAGTTTGAPDLSVTLTGRMFSGAVAPASDGSSSSGGNSIGGGSSTSGGNSITPSTPTTPPASSSGSSS